jgi:hypothetical protein
LASRSYKETLSQGRKPQISTIKLKVRRFIKSAEEGRYDINTQNLKEGGKIRKKLISVAILAAMVLMSFVVFFGGQTTAVPYDLQVIPYSWDPSADPGSGIALRQYDDDYDRITMGHSFQLFDRTSNRIWIGSNGYVKLDYPGQSGYMSYYNYRIAVSSYSYADYVLCPFWDDLNPAYPSTTDSRDVYYYTDSGKTVVTWWQVAHYYSSGSHTFQLVLYATGGFQFNYRSLYPDPPNYYASPSVGVARLNNVVEATGFYYTTGSVEYGTRITDIMSVGTEIETTTLEVVDSGFNRPRLAAGGGGIAEVIVENTGDNDARMNAFWGGPDIAFIHDMGDPIPDELAPGEQFKTTVAFHVMAGAADGMPTSLDFTVVYNSDSGDPLIQSFQIDVQWKESGDDRSEYVHSQDAQRHIRRLWYNIDAGNVVDGGELDSAVSWFFAGNYQKAKTQATKPGGPGLGHWGLAPGQVEGNEGNGNGGLNGYA